MTAKSGQAWNAALNGTADGGYETRRQVRPRRRGRREYPPEFEAAGVAVADRGPRTDETLEAHRR